jgi:hypothetical protein
VRGLFDLKEAKESLPIMKDQSEALRTLVAWKEILANVIERGWSSHCG